jgi:hypothetical protein
LCWNIFPPRAWASLLMVVSNTILLLLVLFLGKYP